MESRLSEAISVILDELNITTDDAEALEDMQFPNGLSPDIAEHHGRLVMIALAHGNKLMAHSVIDRAFDSSSTSKVSLESSIDSIFPTKLANRLLRKGLKTTGDVVRLSMIELSQTISVNSALAVKELLDKHGFSLSPPKPLTPS